MWPFRKSEDAAELTRLRAALEDAREHCTALSLKASAAESAMRAMQKPMTDDGLDAISKAVTAQIADIYASNQGGVKRRDANVYSVIHAAIREATLGKKYWNTDQLAAEAYREAVV